MLNLEGYDGLEESFQQFLREPFGSAIAWEAFLFSLQKIREKNLQACLYWSQRHRLHIQSLQKKLQKLPFHVEQANIIAENFSTFAYENPSREGIISYALLLELANFLGETAE